MKRPKFSILTMLLLMTIFGMAVFTIVQNLEMASMRDQNRNLTDEIGVIGVTNGDSIAIRPLIRGGELNTWRFRVNKPSKEHEYCFGVVDVDPSNTPMLPNGYRPNFQVVECQSEGETNIVLSVWRDENSKWFVKFQEFEGQNEKIATATRMDGFSDQAMSNAVQMKNALIQSSINPLSHANDKHGDVIEFGKDETVWLVKSEKPGQPQESRKAFVLALRAKQSKKPEAE